jgi:hypothetical protein
MVGWSSRSVHSINETAVFGRTLETLTGDTESARCRAIYRSRVYNNNTPHPPPVELYSAGTDAPPG